MSRVVTWLRAAPSGHVHAFNLVHFGKGPKEAACGRLVWVTTADYPTACTTCRACEDAAGQARPVPRWASSDAVTTAPEETGDA